MHINRTKQKDQKVSQAMIHRAVASSTAIETGQSVKELEAKLKQPSEKFSQLKLGS